VDEQNCFNPNTAVTSYSSACSACVQCVRACVCVRSFRFVCAIAAREAGVCIDAFTLEVVKAHNSHECACMYVCMFLTVAVVDPRAPILRLFCAACVPASVVVVEWRARWCTREAVSGASHATEVGVSQCMLREA
jgi:hypothetical protein